MAHNKRTYIHDEIAYENAIRRNIINNAQKTFMKRENAHDIINWLHDKADRSEFASSLLNAFGTYGKLTDAQCDAVLKAITKDEQRKAEWRAENERKAAGSSFVGAIKERREFTFKIEQIIELNPFQVNYNTFALNTLWILRDADGNILTYKGTVNLGEKGSEVTVVATVKEHTEYKGAKQTSITRPKVKE